MRFLRWNGEFQPSKGGLENILGVRYRKRLQMAIRDCDWPLRKDDAQYHGEGKIMETNIVAECLNHFIAILDFPYVVREFQFLYMHANYLYDWV